MKNGFSHIDPEGRAKMVDVGDKPVTARLARASARVRISARLASMIAENTMDKGDVFAAARIAGIQAAKRTAELIPLCHNVPLTRVSVELSLVGDPPSVHIESDAAANYHTGVEMEALTAASVAALTVYDMLKGVDRAVVIEWIRLEYKEGGRSGAWSREDVSD